MMTAPLTDGNLPAARTRLDNAIHALTEPQPHLHNNQLRHQPSLYMQLWDAVSGSQGNNRHTTESVAPVWIEALRLRMEIDTTTEAWQPAYTGVPPTIGRLRCLAERKWRPQDTHSIDQISATVEAWTKEIVELLNPTRIKHLSAPCPACGAESVRRRDSAGELVRQPALQIIAERGCTCLNCRTTWAPEYYMHLSRVLGFDLPAGVLE